MTDRRNIIAIVACPDRPPAPAAGIMGVLAKLDNAARYRRNPRTAEYMHGLARSVMPSATIVEVETELPAAQIAAADHIVLLWPDAIGFGWTRIERAVFRAKRRDARVSALTGRRRSVDLAVPTLLGFRLRRMVERLWLGEIAATLLLLFTGPILVVWDLAKGRR
jgi:hypothetical protein